jgi:hypothetical protein
LILQADDEHVALLKKGVAAWNTWRDENPDIRPDLTGADLSKADFCQANLSGANLCGAVLMKANLIDARTPPALVFDALGHIVGVASASIDRTPMHAYETTREAAMAAGSLTQINVALIAHRIAVATGAYHFSPPVELVLIHHGCKHLRIVRANGNNETAVDGPALTGTSRARDARCLRVWAYRHRSTRCAGRDCVHPRRQ